MALIGSLGLLLCSIKIFFPPGTLNTLLQIILLSVPAGCQTIVTVANFEIVNVFYLLLKCVYASPVTRSIFYLTFLLP